MVTRREFAKLAVALPATVLGRDAIAGALPQARPSSRIDGVQIGTITYSFRSMPDQSAEATLKYVVDAGISAIELMGGPVERFAGAPEAPRTGGGGAAAGRAPQTAGARESTTPAGSWKNQSCEAWAAQRPAGGAGRGRREITPEERAAQQEHAARLKAWRTSVSMEPFRTLRKMYNDAGVTIYAWKQLDPTMSDEELEYVFNVGEALGCTHTTLELPTDAAQLKRLGEFAVKKKVYAAYHTHLQGNMTAFDQAFATSGGNMANVDFGHWVAAGNVGGTPMQFLQRHHGRISSFHLKDRTTPEHCALNLPWGSGETPIADILQMVRKNRWTIPATIELEYPIPEGSNAVKEVGTCLEYCRRVLRAT